jgi:hypothetical protein
MAHDVATKPSREDTAITPEALFAPPPSGRFSSASSRGFLFFVIGMPMPMPILGSGNSLLAKPDRSAENTNEGGRIL